MGYKLKNHARCWWYTRRICKPRAAGEWFKNSSVIFGNLRILRPFNGNLHIQELFFGLRNKFGKSSKILGRWSEIFGKSSKTPSSVYLYYKKNIKILFGRPSFQIYIKRNIFYLSLWPFDLSILTVSIRKMNDLLLLFNGIKTTNNKSKHLKKKLTIFKSSCIKLERKIHLWTY